MAAILSELIHSIGDSSGNIDGANNPAVATSPEDANNAVIATDASTNISPTVDASINGDVGVKKVGKVVEKAPQLTVIDVDLESSLSPSPDSTPSEPKIMTSTATITILNDDDDGDDSSKA